MAHEDGTPAAGGTVQQAQPADKAGESEDIRVVPLSGLSSCSERHALGAAMGKQVSFYMSCIDEADFLNGLLSLGPVQLRRGLSRSRAGSIAMPLSPAKTKTDILDLFLCVIPRDISANVTVEGPDINSHYVIDHLNSEVIEFTRSQYVDGRTKVYGPRPEKPFLTCGRLWYDSKTLDGEVKSVAFERWASKVLRYAKKRLTRIDQVLYAGKDALSGRACKKFVFGPNTM